MTAVANEVGGYEEWTKTNYWYDDECQVRVEGRHEARIKMLITRTRVNTGNYKNKRREAKKSLERKQELEGMGEVNKRNETRKFCTISGGVKDGFQLGKSIFVQTGIIV